MLPRQQPHQKHLPKSSRQKYFDKDLFIDILYKTKSTLQAAAACGYRLYTAKAYRDKDPEFAKRWDNAMAQFVDELEASMLHRAIHGWKEPVFYQGIECGTIRKYSTSLQIFMIKNLKPEKYSDFKVDANTAENIAGAIVATVKRMDELSS